MGYIFLRGQKHSCDNNEPINLHFPEWNIIVKNCVLGEGVVLWSNLNLYGCRIGAESKVGSFVEIRSGVILGKRCKLEPFVFIPEGVALGDGVFVGPNVTFTNDVYPRSCDDQGELIADYHIEPTVVCDYASIGAGTVIRCGVTIGRKSLIGAGSVITTSVGDNQIFYGERATFRRENT